MDVDVDVRVGVNARAAVRVGGEGEREKRRAVIFPKRKKMPSFGRHVKRTTQWSRC